jgi:hypothetical protein
MSLDKASLGIGVVIGGAASFVVATVLYKKQLALMLVDYDERLVEEVRSTVEHMKSEGLDLNNVVIDDNLEDDEVAFTPDVSPEDVKMAEVSDGVDTEVIRDIPAALAKPPLEDLVSRNQKTAYHRILEESVYGATDAEGPTREEEPYQDENITVISQDLFLSNVSGFPQETLTYFADGGVLDTMSDFVDHVPLIGAALPLFGVQSNDPEVVYIRNKTLGKEFEVLKDPGNAADLLPPEAKPDEGDTLQHSIELLQDHYRSNERR